MFEHEREDDRHELHAVPVLVLVEEGQVALEALVVVREADVVVGQ